MRDTQRSKVYAWETTVLRAEDDDEMPFDECGALAAKAWRSCGAGNAPTVSDGRRSRSGHYSVYEHNIRLPRFARRRWYVLHEVAHGLTRVGPAHGPAWCACYADLLQRFGGWTAVRRSMRAWGIKI